MIKPLFKYAGGKFKEYTHINRFFPEKINNYYENLLRESPRALAVGVCQQARGIYDNKKTTHLLISNYELKL